MKYLKYLPLFITALTLSMIACKGDSNPGQSDTAIIDDDIKKLDKEAFIKGYESSGAVLVDLRFPQEFEQGHLDGAININFFDPEFKHKLLDLDKDKTYYLYDKSDQSTFRAMKFMEENGFKKVYILKGGYRDWNKTPEEIKAEEEANKPSQEEMKEMKDGKKKVQEKPN